MNWRTVKRNNKMHFGNLRDGSRYFRTLCGNAFYTRALDLTPTPNDASPCKICFKAGIKQGIFNLDHLIKARNRFTDRVYYQKAKELVESRS